MTADFPLDKLQKSGTRAGARARAKPMREHELQKLVVTWVRTVAPDVVIFAVPNSARRTPSGFASNAVPGLMKGVSDLVVVLPREVLFVELKTPRGRLRPEQREFGMRLNALGHRWAVWRDLQDARNTFKALNIRTREVAQ
jgi:VRR-NUC domain